jgi:hypothetical protein
MQIASMSDPTPVKIELAPGADSNGLAMMLADLVRQNIEAKPHKAADFRAIDGAVAIVADDADVALTLKFSRSSGVLTIHDGIVGIPDVTMRATSDAILALSNMPLTRRFGLPIPNPRDKSAVDVSRSVMLAMRTGAMKVYGAAFHVPMLLHLTRVMSVNG